MIGDRWGVTDDEVARRYPCDDNVPSPVVQAWRGVTVDTTPDGVWPWITQIRLAPYSYDWLDNRGRRSPQQLRVQDEPVAGDRFTTAASGTCGRILSVSPGEQLTGRIEAQQHGLAGPAPRGLLAVGCVEALGQQLRDDPVPLVGAGCHSGDGGRPGQDAAAGCLGAHGDRGPLDVGKATQRLLGTLAEDVGRVVLPVMPDRLRPRAAVGGDPHQPGLLGGLREERHHLSVAGKSLLRAKESLGCRLARRRVVLHGRSGTTGRRGRLP